MKINYIWVLILFFLTLQLLLQLQPQSISYAQTEELRQRFQTILNNIRSCEIKYYQRVGQEEDTILIGFEVIGEEVVDGERAWKVNCWLSMRGERHEAILWVSKSTGTVLKAKIGEGVVTGTLAEKMAATFLSIPAVMISGTGLEGVLPVEEISITPHGRLYFTGPEIEEFGPTKLLVYKWRFEGFATAPPEYRVKQEIWMAPMSFGYLVVKIQSETLDGARAGGLSLLSISLVSPQPHPQIKVRVSADRTRVRPREHVTFSISCSNIGLADGVINLTASVDGVVRESWLLKLGPGESKNLTFKVSFTEEGDHVVRIGDETFTISVKQTLPAKLEVTGLRIEPESTEPGKSISITVTVKNTGDETGTKEIALKIGGALFESRKITLGPGESIDLTFSYTPESEGTYQVEVEGFSRTVTVKRREEMKPEAPLKNLILLAAAFAAVATAAVIAVVLRRKARPLPPPPPPPAL